MSALQRVVLSACAVAIGFGFVACAVPEKGDVQRQWTDTLRELGINPVYPPREDLQVGDIYVRRGNPDDPELEVKKGFVPLDLWIANVRTEAIKDFYTNRFVFPTSDLGPVEASGDGADSEAVEADMPRGDLVVRVPASTEPIFAPNGRSLLSLRQVAFPDFASLSITAGSLSALVPVEALTVAVGFDARDLQQVNVKIPAAESYGLPASLLLKEITVEGDPLVLDEDKVGIPTQHLQLFRRGVESWADLNLSDEAKQRIAADPHVYLDLITEVFYARVIDISISRESDRGAAARVQPVGANMAASSTADEPENAPQESGQRPDAMARAEALNTRLQQMTAGSAVGGSLQFTSVSDSSVSMRRSYERPVAVGYRGITLRVDPGTARIVALGGATGARATAGDLPRVTAALKPAVQTLLRSHPELDIASVDFNDQGGLTVICVLNNAVSGQDEQDRIAAIGTLLRSQASELADRAVQRDGTIAEDELLEAFRAGTFQIKLTVD